MQNRILLAGLGVVMLLLVAAGCEPVQPDVLGKLPPQQARQLQVYSTNHPVVFDPRIHSMETCPFLTYLPNAMAMQRESKEWAEWCLQFYRAKHQEEKDLYRCKCEEELSRPAPPPAVPTAPVPRP